MGSQETMFSTVISFLIKPNATLTLLVVILMSNFLKFKYMTKKNRSRQAYSPMSEGSLVAVKYWRMIRGVRIPIRMPSVMDVQRGIWTVSEYRIGFNFLIITTS